jgi:hypothetical protein
MVKFFDADADPGSGLLLIREGKIRVQYTAVLRIRIRDPGSGIGYLFDPWIRDPGWEKVSIRIRDPGSGMNNPDRIF